MNVGVLSVMGTLFYFQDGRMLTNLARGGVASKLATNRSWRVALYRNNNRV